MGKKSKCLLSHITRLHTHNLPPALHLSLSLPICFPEGSWHRCVIYVILLAVSGSCVSLSCCGSADMVTHDTRTETHTLGTAEQMDESDKCKTKKWTKHKKNLRPHVVPAGMSDSTLSPGMIWCRLSEVFFIAPALLSYFYIFFFSSHITSLFFL